MAKGFLVDYKVFLGLLALASTFDLSFYLLLSAKSGIRVAIDGVYSQRGGDFDDTDRESLLPSIPNKMRFKRKKFARQSLT